jgi:peptidoglycan hydrolase-like protein with peptidoglycan-binding domain
MQDSPDYLGDFERAAFLGALSDYDDNYLGEVVSALGNPASILLRKGSSGPSVVDLQQKLNRLGYGLSTDGQFGPGTETAVKKFQGSAGLTADGIVGSMTLNALNQAVVEAGKPVAAATVIKDKQISSEIPTDRKKKADLEKLLALTQKGRDLFRRRGGDAATVIAESIAPGSTQYQLQSQQLQQQKQDEKEEDKGWGPLQWGLLVGGVAVSGLLIYTLVRKNK